MFEQEKPAGPPAFEPFDIDAEQAILATILKRPETFAIVAAQVDVPDFYDPLHARIFEKMMVLDELDRPIAPVTLHAIMKNDPGILELKADRADVEYSPTDYFRILADAGIAVEPKALAELCRIVTGHRVRRDAYNAIEDAQAHLDRGDRLDTALGKVIEVSDRSALAELQRGVSPDLGDAFDRLAKEMDAGVVENRGLMLRIEPFDKRFGGFQAESFTVIAGRPGMGKSILGTTILKAAGAERDANNCQVWLPTGFSLEMSGAENVARIIADIDFDECQRLGRTDAIHYSAIRSHKLTDAQFERFVLIGQTLRDMGIQVFDEAKMTMQKIRALARARQMLNPGKKVLTVIDHLQIVGASSRYRGNRIEELTEITGLCKALAKQLEAPVIALSQLSRAVESREDKRPVLSDLRESGSIEQDADAVIFLYRPEYYLRAALRHAQNTAGKGEQAAKLMIQMTEAEGRLDVDIAKNRHGQPGDVRLFIDVASGAVRAHAPGEDPSVQHTLPLSGDPLDAFDDLKKRTGQ
jgi:replicative DNA helicase